MRYTIFAGIALGQSIFSDPPTWTDVSDDLIKIKFKRGRNHELDRVECGTASLRMLNTHGHWWRGNTASPLYPYIKPLTLMKVSATYLGTEYPIFYGIIESLQPGWVSDRGGKAAVMNITCVDMFKSFNRARIKGIYQAGYLVGPPPTMGTFPSQLSGERIVALLDEIGWPGSGSYSSSLRAIDAGKVTVTSHQPEEDGTNLLGHIQEIAEAEGGILFVADDGKVTFQDRDSRQVAPLNTSQGVFADNGSGYITPEFSDDDSFIYNQAQVKATNLQVVADVASIASQGLRSFDQVPNPAVIAGDPDAFDKAFTIVSRYKDSKLRCSNLLVMPDLYPTVLFPKVFGFDLSTRITLLLNSADNPAELDQEYHIEAIEHEWDASSEHWRTRWQLWEVSQLQILQAAHAGTLEKVSYTSYADCHDAAAATNVSNDAATIIIGQMAGAAVEFQIYRSFLEFDTSGIGASNDVLVAQIILQVAAPPTVDTEFNMVIVDPDVLVNPLVDTNYHDLLAETTSWGDVTVVTSLVEGTYLVITLNALGIAAIDKTGTSRFGLRSSRDISSSEPGELTDEFVTVAGVGGTFKPRLALTIIKTP